MNLSIVFSALVARLRCRPRSLFMRTRARPGETVPHKHTSATTELIRQMLSSPILRTQSCQGTYGASSEDIKRRATMYEDRISYGGRNKMHWRKSSITSSSQARIEIP